MLLKKCCQYIFNFLDSEWSNECIDFTIKFFYLPKDLAASIVCLLHVATNKTIVIDELLSDRY